MPKSPKAKSPTNANAPAAASPKAGNGGNVTEALKQAFTTAPENLDVAAAKVADVIAGAKDANLGAVTDQLNAALVDADAGTRQSACHIVTALAKKKLARLEPYLSPLLGNVLDGYADKKIQVR
ncbi:hypothetical protein SPRG_18361, partial [Saprolegnia parasitica CBS 223.65]